MAGNQRGARTLVYAPKVRVLIATDNGVIDVSDDIVNGQCRRTINSVSQFSCVLNNRNGKYMNGTLQRMNRITVEMSRVGGYVQVFSGYLDSIPAFGLYVNTCQIQASCTLKLLQYRYWDIGLPASQELLKQDKYTADSLNSVDGEGVSGIDSGIGKMIATVLQEVSGWKADMIHIQQIPEKFINQILEINEFSEDADNAANALRKYLGIPAFGIYTSSEANEKIPVVAPPGANGKYSIADVVSICRAAGFTGESLSIAASVAMAASDGQPNKIVADLTNALTGKNNSFVGLWQVSLESETKIVMGEALDALKSSKFIFEKTKEGKDFSVLPRYKDNSYKKFLEKAKTASLKVDTGIVTYTSVLGTDTTKPTTPELGVPKAEPTSTHPSHPTTAAVVVPRFTNAQATDEFMKSTFGASEADVQSKCVTLQFLDQSISVHQLAAGSFAKAIAIIKAFEDSKPEGGKYKIKQIGSQNWRNKVGGGSGLSMHSFGTTIDINWDTNGMPSAGVGPNSTDLPVEWIKAFEDNGFEWGGRWSNVDYMHFQWMGGEGSTNVDGTLTPGTGATGGGNIFQQGVFRYLFLGANIDPLSSFLQGDLAPLNDVSLLSSMQGIISSSLRCFMSGPDGSFVAFYPDYFGLAGTSPKLVLEDIEMLDFRIDVNDNNLATDVFVIGSHGASIGPQAGINPYLDWANTRGIVNVRQPETMGYVLGQDSDQVDFSADSIYGRFGMRPYKIDLPQVSSPLFEKLQALQVFQKKWSEQYSTNVQFTFMPELQPGMRVLIKSHDMTVYVEEVVHTFGFDTGFTTQATISSPARVGAGMDIEGLPLGRM